MVTEIINTTMDLVVLGLLSAMVGLAVAMVVFVIKVIGEMKDGW